VVISTYTLKKMKFFKLVSTLLLLISSCSQSTNSELRQLIIKPISTTSIPEEANSAAISGLSNGFASYHRNSSDITTWSYELSKISNFGGEGRGPGEIGKVSEVVPLIDKTLVLDTRNKSILKFGADGDFIESIYYDEMIMSIAADSLDNIYFVVVNFDRITVNKSTFKNFSKTETIFSLPIRDLSESAVKLNVQKQKLFLNRYLTNETLVIDLESSTVIKMANPFLPVEAEFSKNGPYKFPVRPVWRSNIMIDTSVFQLRNISDSKSEVYRSDLDGNIDALFTFNHYTTSFFEYGDEVWMFSPDSLYKYPKLSFFK
jgi:hypothetical protein